MATKKKIVPIDWKACDAFPKAPTDQHTQMQVKKASIPLVFIPGIMGSRLERSNGDFVWDPNSKGSMWWNYSGVSGADRKKQLVDDPNTSGTRRVMALRNGTKPDDFKKLLRGLWVKTHWVSSNEVNAPKWTWLPDKYAKLQGEQRVDAMIDLAVSQGWMEVAWGFYGEFLLKLATTTFQEFKRIFHHPVYAIGYDWVADNRLAGDLLTKRIADIKKTEQSYGRECKQVILVSHSMGGLASRASVVPGVGAACSVADVLGVIHGAQPATGAPAAYRRMRAGFEKEPDETFMQGRERAVLGINSAQVVPVLGGCVGGLELLPTKKYTYKVNGKDETRWLFQVESNNKVGEGLPQHGNPYSEIYSEDKDFLRLVYDPNLLDPGAKPVQARTRRSSPQASGLSGLLKNLGAAEKFHDDLKDSTHSATFITWGSDAGLKTFDHVEYRYKGLMKPDDIGAGSDLDPKPPDGSSPSYFSLSGPTGPGDKTVPASSGSFLLKKSLNKYLHDSGCHPVDGARHGFEHSAFYDDPDVMHFVEAAVQELSFQFRENTIHR